MFSVKNAKAFTISPARACRTISCMEAGSYSDAGYPTGLGFRVLYGVI